MYRQLHTTFYEVILVSSILYLPLRLFAEISPIACSTVYIENCEIKSQEGIRSDADQVFLCRSEIFTNAGLLREEQPLISEREEQLKELGTQ